MGITKRKNSVYEKKLLFSELLGKDLGNSVFLINATYQWMTPASVFSLSVKGNTIQLRINVNCLDDLLFSGDRAIEIVVRFRAYFISNYIHCLETAGNSTPQSYFNGLVNLEAICGFNEKAIDSFSPLSITRKSIRPIDIYCAIRALTRLQIDCNSWLPIDVKQYCETQINAFISYSQLPEIVYFGGKPMYSLPIAMKTLHNDISSGTISLQKYSLFSDNGMCSFVNMPLNSFIETCDGSNNPFWTGVALRLIAFSGTKLNGITFHNLRNINGNLVDFQNTCVRYSIECRESTDKLLVDNYDAIKRIAKCVERAFDGVDSKSGALHYIQ